MFISNKFPSDSNASGDYILRSRKLDGSRKKRGEKIQVANIRNKKRNITINSINLKG